jgi:cytochrome oxidase assembly protein ShyY1
LRFLLTRRWLIFALVVVCLTWATWWLGEWQFHRLAERKDSNRVIRSNETRSPAPVADVLARGQAVDDDEEWRIVSATGTYDTEDTVIVRYRTRDGASGIDVVVPLVTGDGTALLVDRGWMASDNQGTGPRDVPAPPSGRVTVQGWVRADATGSSTEVDDHSTRAVSSEQIGRALHLPVYGGFVQLKSEDGKPADGLEPVEMPELDNGPHFFYGLQWWFFGVLAVAGFFYLAFDEWRSRQRGEQPEDASEGPPDSEDAEDAESAAAPDERNGRTPVRTTSAVAERKQRRAAKNARKQAVRAAYQRAWEEERRQRDQSARSMPPSTGTIAPDTKDEAGESRNAATRPNSSGSP